MLIHGLASSPLELQYLARNLRQAGYQVHLPTLPHYSLPTAANPAHPASATAGAMPQTAHLAESWLAQLQQQLQILHAQHGAVVVGGLCIGAVLALRLAQLQPAQVQGVISLSAALHYDGWGNPWFTPLLPLARVLRFAQSWRIREQSPYGVKDERMRAWLERQIHHAGESDAGAGSLQVRDLLQARLLGRQTRRDLARIQAPILIIHAQEDECASPRSAFDIHAGVRSSVKRLVLLDDCYHMISIDKEKSRVLHEMQGFLQDLQYLVCTPSAASSHQAGAQAAPPTTTPPYLKAAACLRNLCKTSG
jgi:carboxylesterase